MSAGAIVFRDLTLGYDRHPAVHHLTGVVEAGDLLAVVGPNGAGKSTLLKGIVGAIRPLSGCVDLGGRSTREVAYLPQSTEVDRSFPIRVADMAAMGLWRRIGVFGVVDAAGRALVAAALAAVGLAGFERRLIGALSGGQFQRVLFARLMLQDASLILLDEPFAAIDARTVGDLMRLVARWRSEGRTVLAVLHDERLVRAHFPKALLLARDAVAWGPTAAALSPENLARASRMGEAWDEASPDCDVRHATPHEHAA